MSEDIELSWQPCEVRSKVGNSVTISVYVTFKKPTNASGWYFKVTGIGPYFVEDNKEYYNSNPTSIVLRPYAGVSVRDLPHCGIVILYDAAGKEQKRSCRYWSASTGLYSFTKSFFLETDKRYNIQLFGLAGSSKSSFINSVFTLLGEENEILDVATAGGHSVRVSVALKGYRMRKLPATHFNSPEVLTPFILWDTWGVERENYDGVQFEAILSGKVERNWRMVDEIPFYSMADLEVNPNPQLRRHCVIMFVPVGELANDRSPLLARTKMFVEKTTEMGIPSLIAVSKVDEVVPNLRNDYNPQCNEVSDIVARAVQYFKIPPNRVFPIINYYKEQNRCFALEKMTFSLISAATEACISHRAVEEDEDLYR